jgi:hypothetical protein
MRAYIIHWGALSPAGGALSICVEPEYPHLPLVLEVDLTDGAVIGRLGHGHLTVYAFRVKVRSSRPRSCNTPRRRKLGDWPVLALCVAVSSRLGGSFHQFLGRMKRKDKLKGCGQERKAGRALRFLLTCSRI